MTQILKIHLKNPQQRLLRQVVAKLRSGAIIVYPTDSGYALGCMFGNKDGLDRIRAIRSLDKHHYFTLMLSSLAHIGKYAKLDSPFFRLLKNILPGAYTFIFEGTATMPSRLLHAKRKTIGVRIPNHIVVHALLVELDEPLLSVSLAIKGYKFYNIDDVCAVVNNRVDLIIDGGYCPPQPTTVIDLSKGYVDIVRKGAGDISLII